MDAKLYVGNLAFTTTEDDLRTLFAQAGNVAEVALIKDRDTGRSKGFAFVTMGSHAEAQKAIGMFNAYSLEERALTVNVAKPREERGGGNVGGAFGRGGAGGQQRRGGGRRY